MNSLKERVEKFHRSLSLAIYDCELERKGKKLTYYYDADVIYPLIMGFEVGPSDSPPKSDHLLVRALLSCEFLGEFYMLRPHALELTERLSKLRWHADEYSKSVFQQRVKNFLEKKGIRKILSKLCDIAEGKKDYEGIKEYKRVKFFLDTLRDSAGDTFAHIEQINGTWRQRLKRYYDEKMLNLDKMGPEAYDLLGKYEMEAREINRILLQKRTIRPKSVFQDALALTILHKMVNDRESGEASDIVRFYTETIPIIDDLEKNKELKNMLSYRNPLDVELETPPGAESVFRDAGYFIMRVWFSELSLEKKDADEENIRKLKELSKELEDLIISDTVNFEDVLPKLKLKEKEVIKLIEDFENLTIMDSIWVGDQIPDNLKNLKTLKKWTEVFKFAEKQKTEDILGEEIHDVREKLESKVFLIQIWKNDSELILEASRNTRNLVKGRIDDIMRDLGLVRWGYSLRPKEKQCLVASLKALLQDNYDDLRLEAGNAAIIMKDARTDPRKCMVMCGIMWALKLYPYIVSLVEKCKSNCKSTELPPSLLTIQAAAEIRTGKYTSEERQEIVDRVLKFAEKLKGEQRLGVLLGIGYVLYHAWKQENIGSNISPPTTNKSNDLIERVSDWAKKCFYLGEEAVEKFPNGELAWAFAVNHCAYVGIRTGVEPKKTKKYFKTLLEIESLPTCWNFRFDDTVGTYYFLTAERLWENTPTDKRKDLDFQRLLEMLAKAEEYFERAKQLDIGDIDIEEHRLKCDLLKRDIEEEFPNLFRT